MAFWKLFATVIITLFIVVAVMAVFPVTREIFPIKNLPGLNIDLGSLFPEKNQSMEKGDMSFVISAERYDGAITGIMKNASISLNARNANLTLVDGSLTGRKIIDVSGYSGSFSIDKRLVSLDGSAESIKLNDLGIEFTNTPLKGTMDYIIINTGNFSTQRIILDNVTGSVSANNLTIGVDGKKVVVTAAYAKLSASSTLVIAGVAGTVSIPENSIEIK